MLQRGIGGGGSGGGALPSSSKFRAFCRLWCCWYQVMASGARSASYKALHAVWWFPRPLLGLFFHVESSSTCRRKAKGLRLAHCGPRQQNGGPLLAARSFKPAPLPVLFLLSRLLAWWYLVCGQLRGSRSSSCSAVRVVIWQLMMPSIHDLLFRQQPGGPTLMRCRQLVDLWYYNRGPYPSSWPRWVHMPWLLLKTPPIVLPLGTAVPLGPYGRRPFWEGVRPVCGSYCCCSCCTLAWNASSWFPRS